VRYGNVRSAAAYVEAALAGRLATAEEDRIDAPAARNEALMLALRTLRGADLATLSPAQAREAAEAVRRRLAVRRAGRLVLTSRGMNLHSALSERLFE
jgi:oxygen-independent coproporphyrinogen-3 oxidase